MAAEIEVTRSKVSKSEMYIWQRGKNTVKRAELGGIRGLKN